MTDSPQRELRVLFVCTGNVCRSAMAEAFLRTQAKERGLRLDVRSAGTQAISGAQSTFEGRLVMSKLGAPIDRHVAVALAPYVVEWADLILGMTAEHVEIIGRAFPEGADHTFTLGSFVDVMPKLPAISDPATWARDAASLVDASASHDIDDPIGRPVDLYDRVAHEIRALVTQFADELERKM